MKGIFYFFFFFLIPAFGICQAPSKVNVRFLPPEQDLLTFEKSQNSTGILYSYNNNSYSVHESIEEAITFLLTADYPLLSQQLIKTDRIYLLSYLPDEEAYWLEFDEDTQTYKILK